MNRKPSRPPSAVALTLASFVLTAAALAGPQLVHSQSVPHRVLAADPAR